MIQYELIPLTQPVHATIAIPGSKSYTNRALIMAALTKGPVSIINPLFSDDTEALIECLQLLGIQVDVTSSTIVVQGDVSQVSDKEYELFARDSGTTIRFLLALLCVTPGTQILKGSKRLQERPIRDLVDGLRQLGADIEYLEQDGAPPLRIRSSSLNPGTARLKGDISSQFFSAILMIAPEVGAVTIEVEGEQISKPYIEMTIDSMRQWGIQVRNRYFERYEVPPNQHYSQTSYPVEGDFSSAGYFLAAAARTGSTITLTNLNPFSKQADRDLLDTLEELGSTVQRDDQSITITGAPIPNIDIDMEDFPDQVQTMAVLAAFAPGNTIIRGVRSLRVKETERVLALQHELKKMGISTSATHDVLTIAGGSPQGAEIDTYNDHRMAMSFAIAGLTLPGIRINNPHVVQKTFPDFWDKLQQLGVHINKKEL